MSGVCNQQIHTKLQTLQEQNNSHRKPTSERKENSRKFPARGNFFASQHRNMYRGSSEEFSEYYYLQQFNVQKAQTTHNVKCSMSGCRAVQFHQSQSNLARFKPLNKANKLTFHWTRLTGWQRERTLYNVDNRIQLNGQQSSTFNSNMQRLNNVTYNQSVWLPRWIS